MNTNQYVKSQIQSFTCLNDCCKYYEHTYIPTIINHDKRRKQKAGIFFYNTLQDKVLLVKSRGLKWGIPKGTREDSDLTIQHCACREVLEETGISIDENELNNLKYYKCDKAFYYFLEIQKEIDISLQQDVAENDANGIGWFRVDCLIELVKQKKIELNSHTKTCFWIFLKRELRY